MAVVVRTIAEPGIALTGTLTFGSAVVTGLTSTASLVVGQVVQGLGIPPDTLVLTVDSTSQVTLTGAAQATGAADLTFLLEPVTLAQAKKQFYLDVDADDAMVARMIGAARKVCEGIVKRAFIATTFDAVWDGFPGGGGYYNREVRQTYGMFGGGMAPGFLPTSNGVIQFPRADLISVTSIGYYDPSGNLQTLAADRYIVEPGSPGQVTPAYGAIWPTTLSRVGAATIRFVAGYGATPASVPDNVKSAILLLAMHLYENRGEANVEIPAAVRHLLAPARWGGYA